MIQAFFARRYELKRIEMIECNVNHNANRAKSNGRAMETARARDLKDLYLLLLDKGRRPHALARAGRARARARAR